MSDQEDLQAYFTGALKLGFRQLRRFVIFIIGISIVLVGVLMVVTPGPAIIVIPIGLSILAIEFAWARVLLKRFKQKAEQMGQEVSERFRKKEKVKHESD